MTRSWGPILRMFAPASALTLALAAPAGAGYVCGDFNDDEVVTAPDALNTLRTAVKLVKCERARCDMTGDNEITSRDALAILRTAVGTGPEPKCPKAGCNGFECRPTCLSTQLGCCDDTTCSGNGTCSVQDGLATCECKEGWAGVKCNAPADLYPFAEEPSKEPPAWTKIGDVFVRPPSYREQLRFDLRPGTFFVANDVMRANIESGKAATKVPFVFPDGELARYDIELKDTYTSDVRLIERRKVGSQAQIVNRFPEVKVWRSLYETDGTVKSVMQVLAVDEGGFVSRGIAKHQSNLPNHDGPFLTRVTPLSSGIVLDDIAPVNGTIEPSTLLITEVLLANTYQAGLLDDCNGLSICSDLCADLGVDQDDPGPACPSPPDPCEHMSPCGEGHGPGEPLFVHQCNDSVDNDEDGLLDDEEDPNCNHTPFCQPGGDIPNHQHQWEAGMDFGLFGDVLWCTFEKNSWPAKLLDRGWHAETPFHKNTGDPDYDVLYKWGNDFYSRYEKLARFNVMGCWVLDSYPQAEECADNLADCGPFASGTHTYPYRFGRDSVGFWQGVKADTWHARGLGMNDPLTAAQAFTKNLIGACEAESIPGFASVVGTNVSGDFDTIPHELGHTANLTHCDVRQVNGLWTLEGNVLQTDTCAPGEYGNHEQARWSDVGGGKLFNCFTDGCASPKFGDPDPD